MEELYLRKEEQRRAKFQNELNLANSPLMKKSKVHMRTTRLRSNPTESKISRVEVELCLR